MSEFDLDDFSPCAYAAENSSDDIPECRMCNGPVEVDTWYDEDNHKHCTVICLDPFCANIESFRI